MANASTRTYNSGGMPGWMTDASTPDGSIAFVDNRLRLIAGNAANENGQAAWPLGDEYDEVIFRVDLVPTHPEYFNTYLFSLNVPSYTGVACLIIRNATTISGEPDPYTGIRIYSVSGGVTTMRNAGSYNAATHPWVRFVRDGNWVRLYVAADSGSGPGSWGSPYMEHQWSTTVPTWNPADSGNQTFFGQVHNGGDFAQTRINAINTTVAPSVTRTQHSFRWYEDNGAVGAATPAALLNTGILSPVNVSRRLRLLVDATTGDPGSLADLLTYRKNGAGSWVAVPVGPGNAEALAQPTWGAIGTGATGTNSCTPSYPSGISAATSKLFMAVTGRSNTASTAVAAPSGWSLVGEFEGGTGSWAADTGTRRVTVFQKDVVAGTETGTVSVAYASGSSGNSTIYASIFRVEVPSGYSVDVGWSSGADTTNGTGYSATGSTSLAFDGNRLLVTVTAQNIDTGTQSSQAVAASGITFGTLSNRRSTATTQGFDHRHIITSTPVSSGSGTVAPTYSYTISANGSGPTGFLVLRARLPEVINEVFLAASSYIDPGGEATAALLPAPAGKTSGDFDGGWAVDDVNPFPAVDLGAATYGEHEACLQLGSPGTPGDSYEFRIDGLDAYTQVPTWEIADADITLEPPVTSCAWTVPTATLVLGDAPLVAPFSSLTWAVTLALLSAPTTLTPPALSGLSWVVPTATLGLDGAALAPSALNGLSWNVPAATFDLGSVGLIAPATTSSWAVPDTTLVLEATPLVAPVAATGWTVPTAGLSAPTTLASSASSLAWTVPAASLGLAGVGLAAPAVNITWAVPDAALDASINLLAPAAEVTWTVPTATVGLDGAALTPGAAEAAWAIPVVVLDTGSTLLLPGAAEAAWAVPTATVGLDGAALAPSAAAEVSWTVPVAAMGGEGLLTPFPVELAWTVPTASLGLAGVALTPAPATTSWVPVPPSLDGTNLLSPTPATLGWVVPTAELVLGDASLLPPAIGFAYTTLLPTLGFGSGTVLLPAALGGLSWTVPAASLGFGSGVALVAGTTTLSWTAPVPGLGQQTTLNPPSAVTGWVIPTASLGLEGTSLLPGAVTVGWTVPTASLVTGVFFGGFTGRLTAGPVYTARWSGWQQLTARHTAASQLGARLTAVPGPSGRLST